MDVTMHCTDFLEYGSYPTFILINTSFHMLIALCIKISQKSSTADSTDANVLLQKILYGLSVPP